MIDYKILIRSYKRPELICTHTLAFMKKQDLLYRCIVLVADLDEKALYEESFKKHGLDVEIMVTGKGAANSYNIAFSSFLDGYPVFCIDDDIIKFMEYPDNCIQKSEKDIDDFGKYLEYGFSALKEYSAGAFSFEYTNPFYKQGKEFCTVGMKRFAGGFFGAFVSDELKVLFEHEEDNIRTCQVLERFGRTVQFNWIGLKMSPMYKSPGGMQSDGSRTVDTKNICQEALSLPVVQKYYRSEPVLNEGLWTLKYKVKNDLKKLENYKDDIKIFDYFGEFPKENLNLIDL